MEDLTHPDNKRALLTFLTKEGYDYNSIPVDRILFKTLCSENFDFLLENFPIVKLEKGSGQPSLSPYS